MRREPELKLYRFCWVQIGSSKVVNLIRIISKQMILDSESIKHFWKGTERLFTSCGDCIAALTCILWCTALAGQHNSLVEKALHVMVAKWQSADPMVMVMVSNISNVWSACTCSFANTCQLQHVNSSYKIDELCGSGSRPSKAAMEHWYMAQ